MSSPRRFFVAFAVCLMLWLGLTKAAPAQQYGLQSQAADDVQAHLPAAAAAAPGVEPEAQADSPFTGLLNAVSPEALHDVLHRYFPTRFKDGIYESDHSAMEAVHRADPPLATSLIRIAKRQNNGTTQGPTTGPTTGATTLPPTTTPPTTTPTTSATSSSSTTQTSGTSPSSTSSRPASSSIPSPSLSVPPGSVISTTTSVAVGDSSQTSQSGADSVTSPTATGTTSSSPRPQKPQTTTFTSTAGNGDVTIVTATTFVPGDQPDATGTQSGGTLQTNAAVPRARNVGVEAFAGVLIGGLFLV